MTQPSPSDLERQARLRAQIAEVREVHLYWTDLGHDPLVAAILTGITLDNLPEGV